MRSRGTFTVGGSVQAGRGLYIERPADRELLDLVSRGELALVLNARQVGKTSLLLHTTGRLEPAEFACAFVDLQLGGRQSSADDWFRGLLLCLHRAFDLDVDPVGWWTGQALSGLPPGQRLERFLVEVLLRQVRQRMVLFVDEVEVLIGLPHAAALLETIRSVHEKREQVEPYQRLGFVLAGAARLEELFPYHLPALFRSAPRVRLTDFTETEAHPLTEGFNLPPATAHQLLRWLLAWTGGHPYLTARLCAAAVEDGYTGWTAAEVDELVEEVMLGEAAEAEPNLRIARDYFLRRAPDLPASLTLYRQVLEGRPVAFQEGHEIHEHLFLTGLVGIGDEGCFRSRNRIYRTVFDERWIGENLHEAGVRPSVRTAAEGEPAAPAVALQPQAERVPLVAVPHDIGQMDSAYQLERECDRKALQHLERGGVTLTLKGPQQMGKSGLLRRLFHLAREAGRATATLSFQWVEGEALENEEVFYRQLCVWLSRELGAEDRTAELWELPQGNPQRCVDYLSDLLSRFGSITLALDEVERVLPAPYSADFFGMLRSWHNLRGIDRRWNGLDLILITAVDPHFLIRDERQSPFNVSTVIEMQDFTPGEVAELNRRYQHPLAPEQLDALMREVGGHPHLVHLALRAASRRLNSPEEILLDAAGEAHVFSDHLINLMGAVRRTPGVEAHLHAVLAKQPIEPSAELPLRSLGLLHPEAKPLRLRYPLYDRYFRRHLHA